MALRKRAMPTPSEALRGRAASMPVRGRHFVLGTSLQPPFPHGCQSILFGMGCFWGAERVFPALNEPQPAVIAYTTTISGMAVSELLNRMFDLAHSDATETLLKLEVPKLSLNDRKARCGCWCASDKLQHRQPLLGLNWPSTKRTLASLMMGSNAQEIE